MPVFIDSGEIGVNSTLPDIPGAISVPNLSKLTGADWLVSPFRPRPSTDKMVQNHLKRGALLVECKRMTDLPGSLMGNDHLYSQAVRMEKVCPNPFQRVLLYTGLHLPTRDGLLRLMEYDGYQVKYHATRYDYLAFKRACTKLMDSGLVRWEGLSSNQEIPLWVADKLRHLREYKTKPVKVVQTYKPLRGLETVEGYEGWLTRALDGIGRNAAAELIKQHGTPFWALSALTDPDDPHKIRGIATGTKRKIRQQMGFESPDWDGYHLWPLAVGLTWCGEHEISWASDKYSTCPLCKED